MKRRLFPLLFLLIVRAASCFSEEGYTIKSIISLPPEFYVGDIVELRIKILMKEGTIINVPLEIPESSWIDIKEIKAVSTDSETEVKIIFTSFHPGIQTLPPIVIGDITLDKIKITTNSILKEKEIQFAPPEGQFFLPGTSFILAVFIGIILGGLVVIFTFGGKIKEKIESILKKHKKQMAYSRINNILNELKNQKNKRNSKKFYIILTDGFRKYLTYRTGINFITATTGDFNKLVEDSLYNIEISPDVISLMIFSDNVKFGGRKASAKKKKEDLNLIIETVEKIEQLVCEKNNIKKKHTVKTSLKPENNKRGSHVEF